jgi:hypothetical protein
LAADQARRLSRRREQFRTYDEKNRPLAAFGVHFRAAIGKIQTLVVGKK